MITNELIAAIATFLVAVSMAIKMYVRPSKTKSCAEHAVLTTKLNGISDDIKEIKSSINSLVSLQLEQQETIGYLSGVTRHPNGKRGE